MRRKLVAVAVAAVLGTSGACATTGNGDDLNDACALAALAILSIPVVAACGTGCVVGGVTACADHNCGGGATDDPASSSSSQSAQPLEEQPAPESAASDDDAEAQRVAY